MAAAAPEPGTAAPVTPAEYALVLARCQSLPPLQNTCLVNDYIENLLLAVLDYRVRPAVVGRAIGHYHRHVRPAVRDHEQLTALLAGHPDTEDGNRGIAGFLWGRPFWNRVALLRRLVAYFEKEGVTTQDALRGWAFRTDYPAFEGRVAGAGPVLFKQLVLRQGVETVKPDAWVHRFLYGVLGRPVGDLAAIAVLGRAAREAGLNACELNGRIWEHERGLAGDDAMRHVFLSHSDEDAAAAGAVCRVLEAENIRCWIAPRDAAPGPLAGESGMDGLIECPVVVLIFSAHAARSHRVLREAHFAAENGGIVLALRIEPAEAPEALSSGLGPDAWLDAFPPPLEGHVARRLVPAVQELLARDENDASTTPDEAGGGRVACAYCGRLNPATARFCDNCRYEFAQNAPQEFAGGDQPYLRWLEAHPGGFVLDTSRNKDPGYMVLHRAACHFIARYLPPAEPGAFTERAYIKVCAPDVEGLERWVKKHGRPDGSFSRTCSVCCPAG